MNSNLHAQSAAIVPTMHEGEVIAKIRKGAGLNSTDFASRIGVAETTLRRWESGRNRPNLQAKRKIAETFNAWEDLGIEQERAPAWFQQWAEQQEARTSEILRLIRDIHGRTSSTS